MPPGHAPVPGPGAPSGYPAPQGYAPAGYGPPPGYAIPRAALPVLPVVETDYVRFFVAPRYRWWKALLALVVAGVAWFVASLVFTVVGVVMDGPNTSVSLDGTVTRIGPWFFIANNVILASGIPIVMLATWLVVGQRPRWMSSVVGGFRWGWFARVALVLLPIWIVMVGVEALVALPDDIGWRDTTMLMIVGILITTPLQAAGEEYMLRGFVARCIGSWIPHPKAALGVSAAVTAVIFMLLHGAGDIWLNAFYLVFALAGSWLVWRTGGLEASVALHVVNNLLAMVLLPFTDFSEMFNREAGVGDPSILINMAVIVAATALIDWIARRRGIVARNAPGRMPAAPQIPGRPPMDAVPGRPSGW